MATELTRSQVAVLRGAHTASDGWLVRDASRIWGIAPIAIMALERKGYLEMPHGRGRARLTLAGQALIKTDPERFGLAKRSPR